MADRQFEHPRLAALYDPLDPDRSDLSVYAALVAEFGAHRVLDIGCGTGTFAVLLAEQGLDVTALDPAAASLDLARQKPGAARVRWIHGDATALPPLAVDMATMTGNVAQAIIAPEDWRATLVQIRECLPPSGILAFETRVPSRQAWRQWTREATHRVDDVPGAGRIEHWGDLIAVDGPLVTFRWTVIFDVDGQVLSSESTLRFRERDEVEADLEDAGYDLVEVRDAPDRPGLEFVFLARPRD